MGDLEAQLDRIRAGSQSTIRELVFRYLRDAILAGEIRDGERLIETDLAQKLGVSRTPVREALRKLELEGLARHVRRRGGVATNLSHRDMQEIYAVRSVLEGLAARLAAEHITPEELERLHQLCDEMDRAYEREDYKTAASIHTEFNRQLYQASRNRRLCEILNRYDEYIEKSQLVSLRRPGRARQIQAEHRAMLASIASRQPQAAELAAREHVERARAAYFSGESAPEPVGAAE